MKIVRAAGQRLAIEPHLARFANTVSVGIGQLPDLWGCGDEDVVAQTEDSFGETKGLGHDLPAIESAVAIGIDQSNDAVRSRFKLLLDRLAVPYRLGDDEISAGVPGRYDRPRAQLRFSDLFKRAACGNNEGYFAYPNLRCWGGILGHKRDGEECVHEETSREERKKELCHDGLCHAGTSRANLLR